MASPISLAGKVAIITGASSGIGAATSVLFSKLGAKLALSGRNADNLKETSDSCKECCQEEPLIVVGDVTAEGSRRDLIDRTVDKFGKIDILINNAGILTTGNIENTTLEAYDNIMDTNVRSVFHLTALAVPHLIQTKGSIVNLSSITGIKAFSGLLGYCLSKAAIDQMTRCVSLDLAPKGVRVNAINPGVIVTNLHKRGGLSEEAYATFLENCKASHPLGRPGDVEEVANTIAFLASDASSFITGVSLPIDGGRHNLCPR
ncbi:3-oxoacyl-[acyl-carrier-protein] reductase FabG-like [Diadema setosum]|uniref:3-oxoacyl-[acyl-carrier-protein] reductase FabG-like n=1 Tax=Diadema antillarum TaxID=105358 RepID=UPI003A8460D3